MTETVKIELYVENIVETQAIATQLAQLLPAGTIILLEGNLGSGKTTLMQALGLALGIQTTIASPTFTLIDEYTEGRLPLYHIDLYRLEPYQIPSLHLEEYWRGEDFPLGVVAIEWSSKLLSLPPQYLKIDLSVPTVPTRSLASERLLNLENLNLDSDEDSLEYLPKDRLIELVALGSPYVEILRQFQKLLVLKN